MMRSLKCFINYIIFVLLILVATLWSFDDGGVLFLKWRLYKKKKKSYIFFYHMESLFSILQIDIRFNNLPRATYSIGLVYVGIYIAEVSKMLYIY
jgi:hypothetical protein